MSAARVEVLGGLRLVVLEDDATPVTGGLVVRAGWADEAAVAAGGLHVVQHVAFAGLQGTVGRTPCGPAATTTSYAFTGTAGLVAHGVATVLERLRDLPRDVDRARDDVAVEHRGAGGPTRVLLRARYGVVGHGSVTGRPLGAGALGADALARLAGSAVTRQGVAAWVAGPAGAVGEVLDRLRDRVADLPDGAVPAPPDPREGRVDGPPGRPTWVRSPAGTGGVLALVPRTAAGRAYGEVLRGLLVRDVLATSRVDVEPLTADVAHLLVVPGPTGASASVMPVVLQLVADLAAGRRQDEVEAFLRRRPAEGPAVTDGVHVARAAATDLVLGPPADADADADADGAAAAVRPQDVLAVAGEVLADAVAGLDASVPAVRGPWSQAREPGASQVTGRRHIHRDAPTDTRVLVVGPAGVTLDARPLAPTTVASDRAAAVLRWPDGRRLLVAADGSEVDVEPTLWVGGEEVVRQVDELWPADLVVERPARPDADVPRPRFDTRGTEPIVPLSMLGIFRVAVVLSAVLPLVLVAELVAGARMAFGWTLLVGAVVLIPLWRRVVLGPPMPPSAFEGRRFGGLR